MIRYLLFLVMLFPFGAQADDLRPGYLELTQRDAQRWSMVWKAPLRAGITPASKPLLPNGCALVGSPRQEQLPFAVLTRTEISCRQSIAGKKIGLSNFAQSRTDVLVRLAPTAEPVRTLRLTAAQPVVEIPDKAKAADVGRTYFALGIDHIVFALDHVLFVLGMVLLLGGGWVIVKAATAFTLAHSFTLAGTALGFFGLPQRPVEALIALSIILIAVEIVKKREGAVSLTVQMPWVVAFLFGLLHGFGFAGALNEIGLPEGEVGVALLAFNLGVEAGQLLIIGLALTVLEGLRRLAAPVLEPSIRLTAYAIGGLASFWLFERTLA